MVKVYGVAAIFLLTGCSHSSRPPAARSPTQPLLRSGSIVDDDDGLPLGKLPSDVTPTAYTLSLTIDPAAEGFSGDVAIHVALAKPTDHIWLHGRALRVRRAQATLADGKVVPAAWQQMTPDGLARLSFDKVVPAQEVTLVIGYDASFAKPGEGLYKVVADGRPYVLAQFEAISARLCFPSFDEPRFKTPFDITVIAPREAVTVSTTRIVNESIDGPRKRIRFATTEKLPAYLLTFAVGPFDVVEAPPVPANTVRLAPLPLRGIAVKGQGAKLTAALETTAKLLALEEDYFGSPYPFDKLDIIASPGLRGAMENVGAIVFEDRLLLLDVATATAEQRRDLVETTAHELAHMWFGNTVTMQWWDDTWLNEAFANWMGFRTTQKLDPHLEAEAGGLEQTLAAMHLDSLMAARQVRQPVESNHDIANAFDSITYDKGMGVLKMIEAYVGADKFKAVVRGYLATYRFANASAEQFFALFGDDDYVTLALRSFVEQPGVPLVDVQPSCAPKQPAQLALEQSRYLPLGSEGDAKQAWVIPVCVRYGLQGGAERQCWMVTRQKAVVTLAKPGCPEWLMPNAGAAGYYRFALPAADTAKLEQALIGKKLTRGEALAFADSLQAAVSAGRTPPADLYDTLPALVGQRDARIDAMVMGVIDSIITKYADDDMVPAAQAFGSELWKGRITAADFDRRPKESDEARLTRTKLVDFLTDVARDPELRREAAKRGTELLKVRESGAAGDEVVDPALAATALGAAIEEGGMPVEERLIAVLAKTSDPTRRNVLVEGLAKVREPAQVKRALDVALANRSQELWDIARPLSSRRASMATSWEWLQASYDDVKAKLPEDEHAYIPYWGFSFCSEARAQEIEAFFAPHIESLSGGPRSLNAVREAVTLCAARAKAHHDAIRAYFKARSPGGTKRS